MTTFNIFAEIKTAIDQTLLLPTPIKYDSEKFSVIVTNDKDESKPVLNVNIIVTCDSIEEAKFLAESELIKVSDLLSWENSLKIKSFSLNSINYIGDKGEKNIIMIAQPAHFNLKVGMASIFSKEKIEQISNKFSLPISTSYQDTLKMWREVLAEESKILQFLLYYRILEHLNGGSRKSADTYIRLKDKNISLRKGLHGEDISLYTYLRDNIHAKTVKFPFEEINKSINGIRLLTFNAIKEFFPKETS